MAVKPSIPKGTRDFGPKQVVQRQYIINTIRSVFELYGFEPIETPAMENMETLTGKYGEEGDKLLFKILNSGDYLAGADETILKDSSKLASHIAEKGLRYDLTVPLARYVVMHRNEITFPFKRYQIQPVWRADRPQKGRYREFWQCDADVIGSTSIVNEAELLLIYDEVFRQLGIPVAVRINHRGILDAIAKEATHGELQTNDLIGLLDKLDKTGRDAVVAEARAKGQRAGHIIQRLVDDLARSTDDYSSLKAIQEYISMSDEGLRGVEQIRELLSLVKGERVRFDPTLGRGLDYYTGTIMEVIAKDVKIGSIGGGGRYDNLTGVFGLDGVSGVGISFGLERIHDVMEELGLFEGLAGSRSSLLITWFDKKSFDAGWKLSHELRANGIACEIYPDDAKMSKQMKYADARGFKRAIIIGDEELSTGTFTVKNLKTGEQVKMTKEEIIVKKLS
jgi:histidyl-tRNA synthetase